MKRGKYLVFLLTFVLLFLVGCFENGSSSSNNSSNSGKSSDSSTSDVYGTYYLYKDEELNKDKYFKISSSKWEDENGDSGTISISGTTISFYMEMFGSNEELYSGTISNGKLEISIVGTKTIYYKEGNEPKNGNTGSDGGTNTNIKETVTITYDANGGSFTNGSIITETKEKDSYLVAPVSPTKQGESFAGWTTLKNGNIFWNFSSDKITTNTTLYAKWNQNDASIISFDGATFDGNNIELVVDKDTDYVSLSNKIVTSSNSIWKLYYDRLGQTEIPTKIAASNSGRLVNGNNKFYIVVTSGNQTNLYELNVYRSYAVTVSYMNGQTNLYSDTAYTGYEYNITYTPSIKGYTFNYWTLNNKKVEKLMIKDYVTLYANVMVNKYIITLDVNEGNSLSNNTYEVTYDDYYQLPVPTRVGYTFNGWEYNGTLKTDSNGNSLGVSNFSNDITLRAKWTINQYQVTTNVNNSNAGTVTGSGTYNFNSSVTITATTNEGYTFVGWYDGNYKLTDELSYTFTLLNSDVTYTAKWVDTPIILEKNIEQAGEVLINGERIIGKSITIIAKTNPGYTFEGWYIANNEITKELSNTFVMLESEVTYTARWTANTNTPYKVEHYLANLGGGYSSTPFEIDNLTGTTDTLTTGKVKTYEGFKSPLITQVNIKGDGSTVIKLYYTRKYYKVSLIKNIDKAGTVKDSGKYYHKYSTDDYGYDYGSTVTITSTSNAGYTFEGWYLSNVKLSDCETFDYIVDVSSVEIEARYTVNEYAVTIDNQVEGVVITGITSGNKYEFETQLTLVAENKFGLSLLWTENGNVMYVGNVCSFNVPSYDLNITITVTTSVYERTDNKIYFGKYPQKLVEDNVLISELNNKAGELPTTTNLYDWIDFNYYYQKWNDQNWVDQGNMYYQDIDFDNDGTFDYRGIYIIKYRKSAPYFQESEQIYWQERNGFVTETIYWFSFEPIEWDILTESNGKVLIISNLILDSQCYCCGSNVEYYNHNGGTGYVNNYELSGIRKYLNDYFYYTAFNELQRELIEITTVDNSASTTNNSSNNYVCNDTKDKLFLLSYQEFNTYNSTHKIEKNSQGTDYAKSQGVSTNWILRSPSSQGERFICYVYFYKNYCYSSANYASRSTTGGVRPVCWITL